MRTPEQVLAEIEGRLRRTWSQVVVGEAWSPTFALGSSALTGRRLADAWPQVHAWSLSWGDWAAAAGPGVTLQHRPESVHRTAQRVPSAIAVASVDVAARLVGGPWPELLDRGRARVALLRADFPGEADPAAVLRLTRDLSDVDFDLLRRTAAWFAGPHASGLTARQVPVEGLGTKWLGRRETLVRRLAGLESLGLVPGRPQRVHLTYLDPGHLAAGRRRHDVATVGDVDAIAYRPRVVLISENRDTAQLFGPVPGGIAVEGDGRGPGAVAALPWIGAAETLWYWGDMDADGLEILHGFRAAGLPVRSLFMDRAAYDRWERYGVDHDHHGGVLGPRTARDLDRLEPGERALYRDLCSADWTRHRRIEQERIPLAEAERAVRG